jgi:hypothetical protein
LKRNEALAMQKGRPDGGKRAGQAPARLAT